MDRVIEWLLVGVFIVILVCVIGCAPANSSKNVQKSTENLQNSTNPELLSEYDCDLEQNSWRLYLFETCLGDKYTESELEFCASRATVKACTPR